MENRGLILGVGRYGLYGRTDGYFAISWFNARNTVNNSKQDSRCWWSNVEARLQMNGHMEHGKDAWLFPRSLGKHRVWFQEGINVECGGCEDPIISVNLQDFSQQERINGEEELCCKLLADMIFHISQENCILMGLQLEDLPLLITWATMFGVTGKRGLYKSPTPPVMLPTVKDLVWGGDYSESWLSVKMSVLGDHSGTLLRRSSDARSRLPNSYSS